MKINTLTHKDADWPKQLDNIDSPPKRIFYRGQMPDGPRVGVIGTRRPSSYGREVVEYIVPGLTQAGICIVSGMAIGIDEASHRAALAAGGETIAILPSAIQKPYPARNARLADEIASHGAVVSEVSSPQPVRKHDFIARNRIIAALCDLLLVVEAAHASGTMHTVRFALNIGVPVAAVPGPITYRNSQGTNKLIADGAHVATEASDIAELLGLPSVTEAERELSEPLRRIVQALQAEPTPTTMLAQLTQMSEPELLSYITELELQNVVARRNDGMYALR